MTKKGNKEKNIITFLFGSKNLLGLLPGFSLSVTVTVAAYFLTNLSGTFLPFDKNPLSLILMAVILGLLIRNTIKLPEIFTPGIQFGIKKILRLGIIVMGIRLSIFSVLKIGMFAVGLVIICIVAGLTITTLLAKWIGTSNNLSTLIAAGTSICGISAIVATSQVINSKEEETAYAIGVITLFGLLATILYPYLTHLVFRMSHYQAGFFLGTAVHDTSQVTASALIYDQIWGTSEMTISTAEIAIVTKLVRNSFMMAVILILAFLYKRVNSGMKKVGLYKVVPLFVFLFIVMAGIRSIGDYLVINKSLFFRAEAWNQIWGFGKEAAGYIIAVAVSSLGLNTEVKKLGRLGLKPLIIGFCAALSVGAISYLLVTLFHNFLMIR